MSQKPTGESGNKDVSESWSKTVAQTADFFKVDIKHGLSEEAVNAQREKFGFNELPAEERMCMLLHPHQPSPAFRDIHLGAHHGAV